MQSETAETTSLKEMVRETLGVLGSAYTARCLGVTEETLGNWARENGHEIQDSRRPAIEGLRARADVLARQLEQKNFAYVTARFYEAADPPEGHPADVEWAGWRERRWSFVVWERAKKKAKDRALNLVARVFGDDAARLVVLDVYPGRYVTQAGERVAEGWHDQADDAAELPPRPDDFPSALIPCPPERAETPKLGKKPKRQAKRPTAGDENNSPGVPGDPAGSASSAAQSPAGVSSTESEPTQATGHRDPIEAAERRGAADERRRIAARLEDMRQEQLAVFTEGDGKGSDLAAAKIAHDAYSRALKVVGRAEAGPLFEGVS